MPAKTILTLLFLISLCVVVFLALHAVPQQSNGNPGASKGEILVAASALLPGTLLRAKDVAWQPTANPAVPGQILRPATAADNPNSQLDQQVRAEIYGAALRYGIKTGEPINRNAIVKPADRDFLQVVLSPRSRAIAIPVAMGGASTAILYPGDWVDVILTQNFKNDPPLTRRSVGETVVENLRVLAIDPLDAKPTGPDQQLRPNSDIGSVSRAGGESQCSHRAWQAVVDAAWYKCNRGHRCGRVPMVRQGERVKPIWAGDVSPALGDAMSVE